jgi:CBS domain-containing protein
MAQDRNQQRPAGTSPKSVRDVMTPNPETVSEKDSIRDVARIMKDRDTGVVPVVNGRKIVGVITDRDIVVRGIAEGKDLGSIRVREIMTTGIKCVTEDAPLNEVLQMMSGNEVRRVPVVNGQDEIVGIVSLGDIATNTNQDNRVGKTVETISEAPPNN